MTWNVAYSGLSWFLVEPDLVQQLVARLINSKKIKAKGFKLESRKVGINHEIYNEPVDVTENTDVEIQDRHLGSDSWIFTNELNW